MCASTPFWADWSPSHSVCVLPRTADNHDGQREKVQIRPSHEMRQGAPVSDRRDRWAWTSPSLTGGVLHWAAKGHAPRIVPTSLTKAACHQTCVLARFVTAIRAQPNYRSHQHTSAACPFPHDTEQRGRCGHIDSTYMNVPMASTWRPVGCTFRSCQPSASCSGSVRGRV